MAFKSVPADRIVSIVPAVVGTGGNPLAMNTMLIAEHNVGEPRIVGVREFGSVAEVGDVFGMASPQAEFARRYFLGYEGATKIPTALWLAAGRSTETSAVLQSASMRSVELDTLKVEADLTVVVGGISETASIDLTAATSFSQIATMIEGNLTGVSCAFIPSAQVFELTTTDTGTTATISFASGELADLLRLTEESGALLENGQDALSFDEMMAGILGETLNFGVITFLEELELDLKKQAAQWNTGKRSRFLLVIQDTSGAATVANNDACFGAWLAGTEQDGTMPYFGTIEQVAAVCGGIAAIDFKREDGRRNIMFMQQAGLGATVTSEPEYTALISNGYTFYAAFATANDRFIFQTNGAVSGKFRWGDNYVNQVYLNSQLQLAVMTMLQSYGSIPYTEVGKSYHRSAVMDPIKEMINFGGIQPLIDPSALSEQQKSIINSQAGRDIIPDLLNKGYVIDIKTADAQTRGNRGSMPFTIFYSDGGSVQSVNLSSVNVQ